MRTRFTLGWCVRALWLGSLLALGVWAPAAAQTSTATVRGTVRDAEGAPVPAAVITATDTTTGFKRSAVAGANGFYVLPGLRPSTYRIAVSALGNAAETRMLQVMVGQSLVADFQLTPQAVELAGITVTGSRAQETRTSEIATNVSPEQIQQLPTPSRNFLDLAALAPGMSVTEDRVNMQSKTFSANGSSPNYANIFIDGTSLKNDLTGGGVAGQDASYGNPFPRNAVQEFRVISQNFKAEYQKSASAVITATTKSGGNTWAGNVAVGFQNKNMSALTWEQRHQKNAPNSTFSKPAYGRALTALSIGGPLIKDKAHIFASYEGNYQDRNATVALPSAVPSGYPALAQANLGQYTGTFTSPFRENLIFGKADYSASANSSFEVSFNGRIERDKRDFGGTTTFDAGNFYRQNVYVGQAKYSYAHDKLLNEAKVDYSMFRRFPEPIGVGSPQFQYHFPSYTFVTGSGASVQDFKQKRLGFRDDVTFSGVQTGGLHVFKVGASVDLVTYDVLKGNDITPQFQFGDTIDCNPACGNKTTYGYSTPYQLRYGTGNPYRKDNNTQFGIYGQDDWTPIDRLTLNLGVRWDVESNMLGNYKTDPAAAAALTAHNSQLPHPLDLSRYIRTGKGKAFMGAIQPRLGFSYALDKNSRTTLFGGWGLYYDRIQYDLYAIDPVLKITHPTYTVFFAPPGTTPKQGQVAWNPSYLTANQASLDALVHTSGLPEAWFIPADMEPPRSNQMNVGVRQALGTFLVSLNYTNIHTTHLPSLNWAAVGDCSASGCPSVDTSPWGFATFLYGVSNQETWFHGLEGKIERPYTRPEGSKLGWGAGLAWTYSYDWVAGAPSVGNDFNYPNANAYPKHVGNDERQRLVANAVSDIPYAWGIQASALLTLGGKYRYDVGCSPQFPWCNPQTASNRYAVGGFTAPGLFPYQRLDVRLRKNLYNFGAKGVDYGLTLDVFNVFNRMNLGCYDLGNRTSATYGNPTCSVSDGRRFEIGAEANF